jgi:hypothetical protein
MEDHEQLESEEQEQYRDPQIDELITELSVLHPIAHALREISEALYTQEYSVPERMPADGTVDASNYRLVFPQTISALESLRKAIEKLRPVPWYARLAAWFGVRRANSEFRKSVAEQKKAEKIRREHMQHLAENAGKYTGHRFRSRYS